MGRRPTSLFPRLTIMSEPHDRTADELISAFLDGELNSEQRAQVQQLLDSEPRYQQMLEELRTLRETLQSLPCQRLDAGFQERVLRIAEDRRSFRFPCPDPNEPHVLAASAIFADGRRAEAVALSGGFGGHAEAGLTAVPLVAEASNLSPCDAVAAELGSAVMPAGKAGFEVVFVLDPTAGYRTLMATGWHKGMMPTNTSTTKQFDSLVQQGAKGSEARPRNSWKKAEATFIEVPPVSTSVSSQPARTNASTNAESGPTTRKLSGSPVRVSLRSLVQHVSCSIQFRSSSAESSSWISSARYSSSNCTDV